MAFFNTYILFSSSKGIINCSAPYTQTERKAYYPGNEKHKVGVNSLQSLETHPSPIPQYPSILCQL